MRYDLKFSRSGIWNAFGRIKRINEKLKQELQLKHSDIVLDIGCDKGDLVSFLQPFCRKIIGIDVNEGAVKNSQVTDLKFMDARETNFPENFFTKIVSCYTIEHIPNLQKLFEEIDSILKPGGLVVLYYPWELFRGMGTMRNAWIFYRNPFKGYKIHLNKLNHNKIKHLIKGTNLKIFKKKFYFDAQPAYITILIKKA